MVACLPLEPLVVADLGVDVLGMGVEVQVANEFFRFRFTHESRCEAWDVRVDRGSGGVDQVFDQIDWVLVADGKPNRGRAHAGLPQCLFAQLRVSGQRRATDDRVGLPKADHVPEGWRQRIEELFEVLWRDVAHVDRE